MKIIIGLLTDGWRISSIKLTSAKKTPEKVEVIASILLQKKLKLFFIWVSCMSMALGSIKAPKRLLIST